MSKVSIFVSQAAREVAIRARLSPIVVKRAANIPKSSKDTFLLMKIESELEIPTKSKPAEEQLLFEQDI